MKLKEAHAEKTIVCYINQQQSTIGALRSTVMIIVYIFLLSGITEKQEIDEWKYNVWWIDVDIDLQNQSEQETGHVLLLFLSDKATT